MKQLLCLSALLCSFTTMASVELQNVQKSGEVNFLAVGKPAMIKIKGATHAPETKAQIKNNKMNVESKLALSELDTGIGMRDEHMKDEYLEVKKYPTALLKIENIKLPDGFEANPSDIKNQSFEGELTLHGKQQKISGIFSLNKSLELVANFNIKLSDYGITIPEYLGVTVADSVTIDTKFNLTKKIN